MLVDDVISQDAARIGKNLPYEFFLELDIFSTGSGNALAGYRFLINVHHIHGLLRTFESVGSAEVFLRAVDGKMFKAVDREIDSIVDIVEHQPIDFRETRSLALIVEASIVIDRYCVDNNPSAINRRLQIKGGVGSIVNCSRKTEIVTVATRTQSKNRYSDYQDIFLHIRA